MDEDNKKPYEIGYGKPPKHTQFQPSISGNPGGRPKKALEKPLLSDLLAEPTTMTIRGRKRKVTTQEALDRVQIKKAAGGDLAAYKAIRQLIKPFADDDDDDDVPMEPRKTTIIRAESARLRPIGEEHITPKKAADKPENSEE